MATSTVRGAQPQWDLGVGAIAAIACRLLLLLSSAWHPSGRHPADHSGPRRVGVERLGRPYASYSGLVARSFSLGSVRLPYCLLRRRVGGELSHGWRLPRHSRLRRSLLSGSRLTAWRSNWLSTRGEQRNSPEKVAAFTAAQAIRWTEIGLNVVGRVLQGLAVTLVVATALAAGFHGRVLAAFGIVAGVGGVAGGLATGYTGFSTLAAMIAIHVPADV